MQQIPNLTSLRFFLAILVVIFHIPEFFANRNLPFYNETSIFLRGNESVWMFFSLSGFLIIKQLYNEKLNSNSINLKNFFLKRIYRIFPLYYLVLIYGFIHYQIILPKIGFTFNNNYNLIEGILLSATFFSNIFLTYSPGGILEILWSIGIEEQFYLFIAPLLYFTPFKRITTILVLVTFIYLVLFTNENFTFLTNYKMYFFFFTFSGICAILLEHVDFKSYINWLLYFLIGMYFFTPFLKDFFTENQYLVFSMLLFGLFLSCLSKKPVAILQNKTLHYLGTISYGIYMFHAITIQIVGFIILKFFPTIENNIFIITSYSLGIIMLSILMAHLSFKYFESYFLNLKKSLHPSNR